MDTLIDIKNYLPHRAPFLMVDMIHKMDETTVETVFKINTGNIFIDNGFFSAAGLIENAAQTCSAIVARGYFVDKNNLDKETAAVIGFISAIKKLQVFSLPETGKTITTIATLVSSFITDDYSLCTMNCKTFDGEKLLLEGEINLFIQEKPSDKHTASAETK